MTAASLSDTPSLTAAAADALRASIIRGELVAGQRIVERTVCRQLNVSRTPLREALKLLEQDGLVEVSRHRGARVSAYSPSDVLDLFAVLANLEALAAELAASRMDETDLAGLGRLHDGMRAHFDAGDLDRYFDANSRIHDRILHLSGNPVLQACHAKMMLQARRGRYIAIVDTARWHQAMGEHELLMAAFRSREPAIAGQVWRNHLLNTGRTVARTMQEAARPLHPADPEPVDP